MAFSLLGDLNSNILTSCEHLHGHCIDDSSLFDLHGKIFTVHRRPVSVGSFFDMIKICLVIVGEIVRLQHRVYTLVLCLIIDIILGLKSFLQSFQID